MLLAGPPEFLSLFVPQTFLSLFDPADQTQIFHPAESVPRWARVQGPVRQGMH